MTEEKTPRLGRLEIGDKVRITDSLNEHAGKTGKLVNGRMVYVIDAHRNEIHCTVKLDDTDNTEEFLLTVLEKV